MLILYISCLFTGLATFIELQEMWAAMGTGEVLL